MNIIKRNELGESSYSVIVEKEMIDLSEFGGEEGDHAELWSVEYGEIPIHNDDQVMRLTKAIESKLNPEGEEGANPVHQDIVEDIVLETVDTFLANL